MTQQAVAPVVAAPVAAPAAEQGEPTMEELAALVGDPKEDPAAAAAPVVDAAKTETAESTDAVAEAAEPAEPAPSEADAALERATKAAAKAREGSRRYAETQRQLSEQNARAQQVQREAEQLRQENAAARQREAAYKQDPYKALKDAGMTDVQLAERALRENSPEAVVTRLQEELAAERAERRAFEQRLEQRATEEREASARHQRTADFVSEADNETNYPRLSQLAPAVQLTMARDAVRQIAANMANTPGFDVRRLSHAQVAEACELLLSPKRAAKQAAAQATETAQRPAVTKPSGKTLTNALAQTRTVAPAQWDDLTEEQQMAHMAANLQVIE